MVVKKYIPERGDIVWVSFDPAKGHEQKGRRPAIVLTDKSYNTIGLFVVCPITSRSKGYITEVQIVIEDKKGVVLTDHIQSFDWTKRGLSFICRSDYKIFNEVLQKISGLLF